MRSSLSCDVVVIGTGMGGGPIGLALAKLGRQVVFCEMGGGNDEPARLRGHYPELADGRGGRLLTEPVALLQAGRWPEAVRDVSREGRGGTRDFVPFSGCGVGGSSALYGMAMERFLPSDFSASLAGEPQVPAWPISLAELSPFYDAAEQLFGVQGERDPLQVHPHPGAPLAPLPPGPGLSLPVQTLAERLRRQGLNPYQLPLARRGGPGCDTCQGFLCTRPCKQDAGQACVAPAVQAHGAQLLQHCRAQRVVFSGRRATRVEALQAGQAVTIDAQVVVLAAGALQTPLILQSSLQASTLRLSSGSRLIGRHLMRHLIDLYLVCPDGDPEALDNRRKELAFNDFYLHQGRKLGTVQSFGRLPPPSMLWHALLEDVQALPAGRALARAARVARPLVMDWLGQSTRHSLTLASIVEDSACIDNRVEPGAPGSVVPRLHYRVLDADQARVRQMRGLMRRALQGSRWTRLAQAGNNQRIAHACGTCRFGTDAASSVLDPLNRVHDVDNLFVTDASFLPASGGTNPSLTIAANALRVASELARTWP